MRVQNAAAAAAAYESIYLRHTARVCLITNKYNTFGVT